MVAHLPAAELAQAEQDVPGRLTRPRPLGQVRHAEPLCQRRSLQVRQLHQDRLGQVAQGRGRRLDVVLAEDVADADAQQLLVLEAVQDRLEVGGSAAQLGQLLPQLCQRSAAG